MFCVTARKIGSDFAALMEVRRWFELLGEPEGRTKGGRGVDEPELRQRDPPEGKECQVQKEK